MKRSSLGFTLVELMLVVLLSGILLAGAFQVEISFHKAMTHQDTVSELQTSMDTLRGYLMHHLPYIGVGLGSTVTYYDCVTVHTNESPFIMHNRNDWDPPQTDLNETDIDNDPDWIEFLEMTVATMNDGVSTTTDGAVNSTYTILNGKYSDFRRHNLYSVVAFTFNGRSCLFRVSRMSVVSNTAPVKFRIDYGPRNSRTCMNSGGKAWAACFPGAGTSVSPTKPFQVSFMGLYPMRALRVETTKYPVPMLTIGYRPMYRNRAKYVWYPVMEGVEDMQVAYHLDLSNPMDGRGDLWINTRDLQPSEYGRVVALRLSFVIRSKEATSKFLSSRPAMEDRSAGTPDRYVRRTMSMVVKMRTIPQMGGQL